MLTQSVSFSELSKNSKRVAERLDRAYRLLVTRRDGEDLYLTTAGYDQEREETADVTARLLAALLAADGGARVIGRALPAVFPWARHLSPRRAGSSPRTWRTRCTTPHSWTCTPASTARSWNGGRRPASSPTPASRPGSPGRSPTRTTAR
ncbi:hypothetical protein ACQ86F_21520 [Streptomyces venezuelae ATCC 10712]